MPAATSVRCWTESIPSVPRSAMIVPAANSSGTIVSRTRSELTAVQENRPALDRDRAEHAVRPPRIRCEQLAHSRFGFGDDDVHRVAIVLERASEHDLAVVHEPVHERGMLFPAVLLSHVA